MSDVDSVLPFIQPGWVGVEIGVAEGHSALALLEHGVRFLWLIDPWAAYSEYPESNLMDGYYEQQYRKAMDRLSIHASKHGHLRMTSKEAAQYIPAPVDFVWIDGNHTYEFVKDDIKRYWPLIRPGGLMCGHDYCNAPPTCEVKRAVDDVFTAGVGTFPDKSSCWIVHKHNPLNPPTELLQMFSEACTRPTDIHQHLTVLRDTGSGCEHITEMGVGTGQSTLAWLLVQPNKLVCYDWGWQECIPTFQRFCGKTDFRFYLADTRIVNIEPTDLLFLDTRHNYDQLITELTLHANKVRRFIVIHDTTTFADHGEDNKPPGMWQAIEHFLDRHAEWQLMARFHHNNGLTILKRVA